MRNAILQKAHVNYCNYMVEKASMPRKSVTVKENEKFGRMSTERRNYLIGELKVSFGM